MVEPLVEPYDKLEPDEIKDLPPSERGKFYESAILALINVNGRRGLSTSEIEKTTGYPKNTLLKSLEGLFHKRKIHRISRGKFSLYYPNGTQTPNNFKDVEFGQARRYGVKLIENVEGKFVHLQEREIDENGFVEDIGGTLIPISVVPELINLLKLVIDQPEKVLTGGKTKWQK